MPAFASKGVTSNWKGNKMLKNLLMSAAMLLPVTALAAPVGVTLSPNKAITVYHGAHLKGTLPAWAAPRGKKAIIDTLGSPVTYDEGDGWTVSNAQSETGAEQWIAYPITPKKSTTITEIVEAVGYVAGADSVTVALLADSNGSPGAVLEQKVVKNLETFGDCCSVAVDKFKKGVAVTGGTTYWVAAILPSKKEATTWDAFNFSTVNTQTVPFAYFNGVWNVSSGPYTGFAVYGS
jgi:hypothetical protein